MLFIAFLFFSFLSCNKGPQPFTPKICKIGNHIWTAENLVVETFRNGDPIPYAPTEKEWLEAAKNKSPAWTDQNWTSSSTKDPKSTVKLYNWYAVNDPRGLAPKGWHIPSREEWLDFVNHYQEEKDLKAIKSANGWRKNEVYNLNGNNKTGFNALPSGYTIVIGYDGARSSFNDEESTSWWSSTSFSSSNAFATVIGFYSNTSVVASGVFTRIPLKNNKDYEGNFSYITIDAMSSGRPVRCIKGEKPLEKNSYILSTNNEVKIGRQIWMGKNLNVERFRNGEVITEARTEEEWDKADSLGRPAWCYAENIVASGEYLGKLYNWYAINDWRGLAPKGWRIADTMDWRELANYLQGNLDTLISKDGGCLTASRSDLGKSTNNGFAAFASFSYLGSRGSTFIPFYWWTADKHYVIFNTFTYQDWEKKELLDNNQIYNNLTIDKPYRGEGYPVRCIKIN